MFEHRLPTLKELAEVIEQARKKYGDDRCIAIMTVSEIPLVMPVSIADYGGDEPLELL